VPRVVLGLTMYRAEEMVAPAIESLLAQDYPDFAVLAIDDASGDRTVSIASEYAAHDPRLVVEANPERLGIIPNWNRVLARAKALYPEHEFFAWVTDNDHQEPGWVSTLVRALDENPEAALAYSWIGQRRDGQLQTPEGKWRFDSRELADPFARMRATRRGMRAGHMVHGLFRRSALDRTLGYPVSVFPDVLLLTHLSLHGPFVQVPKILWHRSSGRTTPKSRKLQRAALFGASTPRRVYLPASLQHSGWLLRWLVFGGLRPAGMGRAKAALISVYYFFDWYYRLLWHRHVLRRIKHFKMRMRTAERRLQRTQRTVGKWVGKRQRRVIGRSKHYGGRWTHRSDRFMRKRFAKGRKWLERRGLLKTRPKPAEYYREKTRKLRE
jgi:glycosyltransferase involved in cell wall biosynthesis